MDYKDNLFYTKMENKSDSEVKVTGYLNLGGGDIDESSFIISKTSILGILDVLRNYEGLVNLTLNKEFDNDKDIVDICIKGSDRNPVVKIYVDHKMSDGTIDEGVLTIPYRPFEEDWAFYYLGPFMEELKKFAH